MTDASQEGLSLYDKCYEAVMRRLVEADEMSVLRSAERAIREVFDIFREKGIPIEALKHGRMAEFGSTFSCDCGENHVQHIDDPTASLGEDDVCEDCGTHLADQELFRIVPDEPTDGVSHAG